MNNQNVFDTAGPDGERLATLAWLLFGGGLVLFVAVLGFLLVALYGAAKARRTLGHPRFIVAGGIIMPVVVLTALLAHTLGLARALGLPLPGDVPPLRGAPWPCVQRRSAANGPAVLHQLGRDHARRKEARVGVGFRF